MNYKIGDRVLCKRDYNVSLGNFSNFSRFKKDKHYKILYVGNNDFSYDILIRSERGEKFGFDLVTNNNDIDVFYDYFYTPDEIRKMKLERINGI